MDYWNICQCLSLYHDVAAEDDDCTVSERPKVNHLITSVTCASFMLQSFPLVEKKQLDSTVFIQIMEDIPRSNSYKFDKGLSSYHDD